MSVTQGTSPNFTAVGEVRAAAVENARTLELSDVLSDLNEAQQQLQLERSQREAIESELCAAECQFAKITTFPGDECHIWTANMSNTVLTEMNEFDVRSLKRLKELVRFLARPPVSQVPPIAIQKKFFYLLLKTENDRERLKASNLQS